MKKRFPVLLSIILMCGCNNLDFAEKFSYDNIGNSCTLTATIEQPVQARSTVNYVGNVSWSDDDCIGVFGERDENVKFHYASKSDDIDNFTGNFDSEHDKIQFAYYPYNQSVQYDRHSIRFKIPENNDYHSENKAPMIGQVVSDKHINFYQTGGVLLLKVIGMPQNAKKIVISSDDESPFLSGSAVIANIDSQYPICKIENGSHIISFDISTLMPKEKLTRLYVPLQIGFYEKLAVAIFDENNNIIKKVSMSNTDIVRGTMINASIINCSDKLYCTIMPQICFEGTQWVEGMITSSEDLLLRRENEDKSSVWTIYNLRNQSALSIATDSLGNVIELFLDDEEYISVVKNDHDQLSFYHCLNKTIDYIESTSVSNLRPKLSVYSSTTRAGVDKIYFFQAINDALSIFNVFKNVSRAVSARMAKSMVDASVYALEANMDAISIRGTGNDEVDLFLGIIGSNANALQVTSEIASYAEKKYNKYIESFYYSLCGATIFVTKPTIEGNQIHFGYSVRNTSFIPKGNFDNIDRKCYVSVIRQLNGTREPGVIAVSSGEKYGFEDIVADNDFDNNEIYIPMEKGYTYYFIARIALYAINTQITLIPRLFREVTYSSDIESISTDNIGEIKENSILYKNDKIKFDFTIYGENLWGGNMGVELYHDGEKVLENYDNIGVGNRLMVTLDRDDLDCDYSSYKAKAKGKWQLRSYVPMEMTGERCYSQFIDFDKLVYDKYPTVTFFNPIIQKTEEISTSTRSDDDSKKYITFFSYGLDIQGAFWMSRIDAKSDTEGPIGYLSSSDITSDVQEAFDYSWIYSEKNPITPTLWYDITLRNGITTKSANDLKFTGYPISNIEYNDIFISSSK